MAETVYRKVPRDFDVAEFKSKPREGFCHVKFCRNKTCRNTKVRKDGSPIYHKMCGKCQSRREKQRNPIRYFYRRLRNRAKERGHYFGLTLEEWTKFVTEHDLLAKRGKTATSLSVDRHDPRIGYVYSNLRVLTLSKNSSKGTTIPGENNPF